MPVDIKSITQLRAMTGAGMGDCKAALEEAGGDMDKAVEIMRKKGVMKAAKKADRTTKEGVIALAKGEGKVAAVGLACETDFVALSEGFITAVNELAAELLASKKTEQFQALAEEKIKNELVVRIGENLVLAVNQVIAGPVIGTYLHSNKKIAAVVVLNAGPAELANNLAMQVAAMAPKYVKPEDVPEEEKKKEKEIYRQQLKNEGKAEAMWDKIIEGKLAKYYTDVCLLKQAYIKDDKVVIEKLIKEAGDQAKEKIEVVALYRFAI